MTYVEKKVREALEVRKDAAARAALEQFDAELVARMTREGRSVDDIVAAIAPQGEQG